MRIRRERVEGDENIPSRRNARVSTLCVWGGKWMLNISSPVDIGKEFPHQANSGVRPFADLLLPLVGNGTEVFGEVDLRHSDKVSVGRPCGRERVDECFVGGSSCVS